MVCWKKKHCFSIRIHNQQFQGGSCFNGRLDVQTNGCRPIFPTMLDIFWGGYHCTTPITKNWRNSAGTKKKLGFLMDVAIHKPPLHITSWMAKIIRKMSLQRLESSSFRMQVQKGTNKIISFNKDMPLTKLTTKPWECIGDTLQLVSIIESSIETRKEKNKKQKQVLGLCDRFFFSWLCSTDPPVLMLVDYIDYFPASMAQQNLVLKGLIFKSHNKNAFMYSGICLRCLDKIQNLFSQMMI